MTSDITVSKGVTKSNIRFAAVTLLNYLVEKLHCQFHTPAFLPLLITPGTRTLMLEVSHHYLPGEDKDEMPVWTSQDLEWVVDLIIKNCKVRIIITRHEHVVDSDVALCLFSLDAPS